MKWYCSMIGDYESLLILEDDEILPIRPSISEKSLEGFCLYKSGLKGSPLTVRVQPVKSVTGKDMVCDGGWKNGKNMSAYLSAMSTLHTAKGNRGPYTEPCPRCFEMPIQERHRGCEHHPGNPHVFRTGNPRMSETMLNTYQNVQADLVGHVVNGDTPLTPWELLQIREHLLVQNCVHSLQIWTMIIIGTALFLRSDEILDLKFNDKNGKNCIRWDLCQVRDGHVVSLAFSIQGT